MSTMLIKNGLIVTMDRDLRVLEGGVLVEDSEIKEIGNVEEKNVDEIIDAENKIVMPGLVCAYTRPYKLLLRAAPLKVKSPSDFTQKLQRVTWPFDESLTNEDIRISALASCSKLIKTGVTFFASLHSSQGSIGKSLDSVAFAAEKAGLRAFVGFEASERNTHAEGARGMRENIRFLENIQKKGVRESLVRGMVGVAPSFTASDELLRHGKRVANRFDVPLLISAAECELDTYHNLENFGKRTIERLRDVGVLSSNTVLANCVDVNKDELSILERAGAKVAHNPMGNMVDAVGVSPVVEMRERGIPIGLGNNGYILDSFENIRTLYLLHKAISGDPRTLSAEDALRMATVEGAKLYGMGNKIGSIEPGKRADIIIVNPEDLPTPLQRVNVMSHIVNSVRSRDVETVIVGGDLVMKNHNIKTLDEKRAMKKSKETARKVWKKFETTKR